MQQAQIKHIAACSCPLCLYNRIQIKKQNKSDIYMPNNMNQFIAAIPPQLFVPIEQTIVLNKIQQNITFKSYQVVQNEQTKKQKLICQNIRPSSIQSPNITIYYENRQINIAKYKLSQQIQNKKDSIIYIQPYQPIPTIRIQYNSQEDIPLDGLLRQHLKKQQNHFKLENIKKNQQFLQWIYTQYGQQIFFRFLTQIYLLYIKLITRSFVTNAVFYWVADPIYKQKRNVTKGSKSDYQLSQSIGRPKKLSFRPKILNIKGLKINYYKQLFSFHQQYKVLVKQKIYQSPKKTISAIKNPTYRVRLEKFREKLHNLYQNQQQAALSCIKQEKAFQYQQDSDEMARLLIPGLGTDKTLRQVLNDPVAFSQFITPKKLYRLKTQNTSQKKQIRKRKIKSNSKLEKLKY